MEEQENYIDIALPDEPAARFERPYDFNSLGVNEFDLIAREIARNYIYLTIDARGKRREGANAWLMRVTYDLLVPMLEQSLDDPIIGRLNAFSRYGRGQRPSEDNFFQLGLMAIFAHSPKAISRQVRERLGKRLYHAARHKIPIELLAGFFKQINSKGLEIRAVNNEIEPGFERWIVRQCLISENPLFHSYPDTIRDIYLDRIGH